MAATRSAFPYSPSTHSPLHRCHRLHGRNCITLLQELPSFGHIRCFKDQQDSREFGHGVHSDPHSKREGNNQPKPALPPKPVAHPWLSWAFWAVLYIAPLANIKDGKPSRLVEKVTEVVEVVEDVVETVEDVAEVVDALADVVEKASSDLADDLPSGSMLKHVAEGVEKAADAVGDGAEQTVDLINKVQDFKEELDKRLDDTMDEKVAEILHSLKHDEGKEKTAVGLKEKEVARPPEEERAKEEASNNR